MVMIEFVSVCLIIIIIFIYILHNYYNDELR